jgi:NifU-like protein
MVEAARIYASLHKTDASFIFGRRNQPYDKIERVKMYPPKVIESLSRALQIGKCENESANGLAVSFECGSAVRFSVAINLDSRRIDDIAFTSTGCGFAVAAASLIADAVRGRVLMDLRAGADLEAIFAAEFGPIPTGRTHCVRLAANGLRQALGNYRRSLIEEFRGEKALICTCFGVTEDTLVNLIEKEPRIEMAGVIRETKAGSGCGSCQFLIQELIDAELNQPRF